MHDGLKDALFTDSEDHNAQRGESPGDDGLTLLYLLFAFCFANSSLPVVGWVVLKGVILCTPGLLCCALGICI